jgi:hypothetical protein
MKYERITALDKTHRLNLTGKFTENEHKIQLFDNFSSQLSQL